jgi:carbamoyltransferase
MKLLGIRVGDHDSNFSFSDGTKVFYHKMERELQIKHYGSTDPLVWIPVLNKWGYSPNDIDAICVTYDQELGDDPIALFPNVKCPIHKLDHHLAHALSVWPITNSLPNVSFVFDGDGDFGRCFSVFKGTDLIYSKTTSETRSFGEILESIGPIIGVKGNQLDISGKLMALKSYGTINEEYLKLCDVFNLEQIHIFADIELWETVTQTKFKHSYLDYLATLHEFANIKFVELFKRFASSNDHISFTGGVAQNSVLNGIIQKHFPNCIIPPHASDDGLSLGCLEFLRMHYKQKAFDNNGFPFWQDDEYIESPSANTINIIANALTDGKIVAWHQGVGEIGPRALGHRSILMDPRIVDGKKRINEKVKHREEYRPFGCSILKEHCNEYFDMNYESPYMLHVCDVKAKNITSVTHIDNTCRVQTVDKNNKTFYDLLSKFYQLTGCPLLLNTSLNNNGKPISSSPKDSLDLFYNSDIDILCVGNKLYVKPNR